MTTPGGRLPWQGEPMTTSGPRPSSRAIPAAPNLLLPTTPPTRKASA
ncbi:hypothetical protein ACWEGE_04305 [Amycolatopsis sp. NPDC004747]